MLLAASTQRTIGLVILAIVFLGGIVYIYFNIRSARDEVGSEIELASNRKPYLSDEDLEGKKLDLALGSLPLTALDLAPPPELHLTRNSRSLSSTLFRRPSARDCR